MSETQTRQKEDFLYKVARFLAVTFLHSLMPMKMTGAEKLGLDAPFILISNHNSMLDPFVLAYKVKRYPITFLGKKELVKSRFGQWLFGHLGMIPVDRGHTDMEAMRACMKVLKNNGVLGIFPEGTRHHEGVMEEIESGVALIALRSGVPLIPIYIKGRVALFHFTRSWVGDPIPTDDLRAEGINADTSARLNARITETFRAMVAAGEKKD